MMGVFWASCIAGILKCMEWITCRLVIYRVTHHYMWDIVGSDQTFKSYLFQISFLAEVVTLLYRNKTHIMSCHRQTEST